MSTNVCKDDLKIRLTPIQWYVTQEKGTERPFSGCYNKFNGKGTYCCIVCEQELFSSKTKYDSGCGWPAFNEVLDQGRVKLIKDTSLGLVVNDEHLCSFQSILRLHHFASSSLHFAPILLGFLPLICHTLLNSILTPSCPSIYLYSFEKQTIKCR
ncbi:methionine-R-sulfoxide reductase B1 isoform X2 [Nasonia vitripennis]|uniref:peptide-methionine (R)-S-oxide reductase n=1 Tax=Nasonia vitripennis TaxID=7425 RepID=A0A7M7T9Z8_NASVI|nr:methionine-R-sulfoxide reductase B1 isoform X2 [Nasonia vitripennis]